MYQFFNPPPTPGNVDVVRGPVFQKFSETWPRPAPVFRKIFKTRPRFVRRFSKNFRERGTTFDYVFYNLPEKWTKSNWISPVGNRQLDFASK